MDDEVERYLIMVWSIVTTVLSIFGNSLVLVASLKYDAIKIDILSKILVRSIAIADIGYTVVVILPTIPSTITLSWEFGDFACKASVFLQYWFGQANIVAIVALSISKLTCLLYPFHARMRTVKTGYITLMLIWSTSLVQPVITVIRPKVYVPFLYRCVTLSTHRDLAEVLLKNTFFLFIPLVVIIVSTLWILIHVNRKTSSLRPTGVFVVLLISGAFIISWFPFLIAILVQHFTGEVGEAYTKLGIFCIYINTACNPYLYFFSNKSFNDFVTIKVFKMNRDRTATTSGISVSHVSKNQIYGNRLQSSACSVQMPPTNHLTEM